MYITSQQQQLDFISEIAPLAQKSYKELGKVLPSVCIGMACVESNYGYGTDGSRLMYNHNAVLGHKVGSGKTATKYWTGTFFVAKTKEEYTVGTHTVIKSAFRSFPNLEMCIYNFYELLNTSLYAGVKAGVDYATQMAQIKACGYMTSSTEVSSVKKIIQTHNLTQYDDLLADGYKRVTATMLNVRTEPNTKAPIFITIPKGTKVKVENESNGWAKLECYVSNKYIQ